MKNIINKNILTTKGFNSLKTEYKNNLKLNQFQKNILVGTLLGDGYLEPKGKNRVYRYYFNQKESNKFYVDHIYYHFQDWCPQEPKIAKSGVSLSKEMTQMCYLRTCTHTSFTFYANQFYKYNDNLKRIKIIPPLLIK